MCVPSPVRGQLLAAGLLGRGFALWTPHMSPANTTLLIRRLLEIVCTGENSTTRSEANAALLKVLLHTFVV